MGCTLNCIFAYTLVLFWVHKCFHSGNSVLAKYTVITQVVVRKLTVEHWIVHALDSSHLADVEKTVEHLFATFLVEMKKKKAGGPSSMLIMVQP